MSKWLPGRLGLNVGLARQSLGLAGLVTGLALLATSCASPPLTLYTLDVPSAAAPSSLRSNPAVVVEVRRVSIPDYLDSEDILLRKGNVLARSSRGRWATRLSLGITHFLAARLAQRRPDAFVTDQLQDAPDDRISVTINQLDVTSAGSGMLDADWQTIPRDPRQPSRRARGRFTANGPVATDQDVVTLMTNLLLQLADAMDVPRQQVRRSPP